MQGEKSVTKNSNLILSDESISRFKLAYAQYWESVKHSVDADGWVYSNDLSHILDFYFEANTKKPIEFEKHYEGEWRGCRWRPQELSVIDDNSAKLQ